LEKPSRATGKETLKMTNPQPENFSDLNGIHRELEDIFYWHQVALLRGDYGGAKALLDNYEETLSTHMAEEEEILIPLYVQRAPPLQGGKGEFFKQEHDKIKEWIGRLKLRMSRVENKPDPKIVIDLFDDEAWFKKIIEHHTLRENRILYPALENVVTEKEKSSLLRLLTFSPEGRPPSA
jgi:iron-sulfur cluster repair protein YtfE (RIC family)